MRSLGSIGIGCAILSVAVSLVAATGQQTESTSSKVDTPAIATKPETPAAAPTPVFTAPTLAEMRAMSPDQLEVAGDELRGERDYRSALDCYHAAVRKHATAMLYNKEAISELMLQHYNEALTAAQKAVRKDKKLAEAWNNIGVAYYIMQPPKFDQAIRNYSRAISLNPESASFHNNLAVVLTDTRQFERAMSEYRKAYAIDPTFFEHASEHGVSGHMNSPRDRAQFAYSMARLFAENGNLERALHFLRSAIEDGYPKIENVYHDKEFATLRKDERFIELMKSKPVAIHAD